jgi:putative DNA primase/helicase
MSALPKFIDPLPDVPVFLKTKRQWLLWKLEEVNGKLTKVPYQLNGKKASSTNPDTWTDYQTAVTGAIINHEGGIGFVVNGDIIGIDIDGCRDPKTGVIAEWADEVIEALGSYTEVTPSGTGVRVLVLGALPEGARHVFDIDPKVGYGDKVKFEVYSRARYFTVSGKGVFQEADLEPCELTALYQMLKAASDKYPVKPTDPTKVAAADMGEGTQIVYEPGTNLKTSKYSIFMHGTITRDPFRMSYGNASLAYPSQSEADLGFATVLALVHDGDIDKMDSDFRNSPLYREKWERDDYRERTFRMAGETASKIKATGPQFKFEQTATPSSATAEAAKASEASKDATGTFPHGDNEIPAFDDSVITGVFREVVDFVTADTTIPRQFPFLAAKVYVGSRMAGKMKFEGMQDDPTMYGTAIGETGTSKGLSWERTIFQTLLPGDLLKHPLKVLYSFDSGAGLRDAFFDPPKEKPVIGYIDEVSSLGHKAGEKKNPEIVDTIIELANGHRISRVKAKRSKQDTVMSHDAAYLSMYMCGQHGKIFMSSFPGRTQLGLWDRFYPEFSEPIEPGDLPLLETSAAFQLLARLEKYPFTGKMTMGPGVNEAVKKFWLEQPKDIRVKVRFKSHLMLDMYFSAWSQGRMVATPEDLDVAIRIFQRQIVIRRVHFCEEIPDRVGYYVGLLKSITKGMRKRLVAGELVGNVAMSVRDFQTDTHAFRDNELVVFNNAWRNYEKDHLWKVKVKARNGQTYEKFIPMPGEDEMWAAPDTLTAQQVTGEQG